MPTFTYNCTHTYMHTCVGTHTHTHTCYLEHRHPHTVGCSVLSASPLHTFVLFAVVQEAGSLQAALSRFPCHFSSCWCLPMAGIVRCLEGQEHNRLVLEVPLEVAVAATLAKFGLFGPCTGRMVSTTVAATGLQHPE